MPSLARIEWLKLKHYRPFWVLCGLYVLTLLGAVGLGLSLQQWLLNKMHIRPGSDHMPFRFPMVWHSVAYIASFFHIFPALLVILNVTNEYSYRTQRQNLLDGWSRSQFVAAKAMVCAGICLFCSASVAATALAAGLLAGSLPDLSGIEILFAFALQSWLYLTVAALLSFFIQRAALTLAAFLTYTAVLEGFLSSYLRLRNNGLSGVLPLQSVDGLVPMPMMPSAFEREFPRLQPEILLALGIGYALVMWFALSYRFRTQDL